MPTINWLYHLRIRNIASTLQPPREASKDVPDQHRSQAIQGPGLKNGKFIEVSDADLKGKWSVVFFYPADFTFVCPTELEDLADNYAEFQKLGVEVYSVSTDTHFAHKAWHDTSARSKKIKYTMVGDPTGTISRNFDVHDRGSRPGRARHLRDRSGTARSRSSRSTPAASAATPRNCCARSRPPSTSPPTRARSARPSGRKARRPWPRRWTWSARSESSPHRDPGASAPGSTPARMPVSGLRRQRRRLSRPSRRRRCHKHFPLAIPCIHTGVIAMLDETSRPSCRPIWKS